MRRHMQLASVKLTTQKRCALSTVRSTFELTAALTQCGSTLRGAHRHYRRRHSRRVANNRRIVSVAQVDSALRRASFSELLSSRAQCVHTHTHTLSLSLSLSLSEMDQIIVVASDISYERISQNHGTGRYLVPHVECHLSLSLSLFLS